MIKRLIGIGLFSVAALSSADDGSESLTQLVNEALGNHPILRSGAANIDSARSRIAQAKWAFFPTPQVGVQRRWVSNDGIPDQDDFLNDRGEVVTAGLTQVVWSGGQRRSAYRQAKAEAEQQRAIVEQDRLEIAINTVQGYGEWLSAYRKFGAWSDNEDIHEDLKKQLHTRLESGVVPHVDKTLVESRIARVRSERELYANEIDVALYGMAQLLGRPVSNRDLQALTATPIAFESDLVTLLDAALVDHPILRRATAQIDVRIEDYQQTLAQRLPEVTVNAQREMPLDPAFDDRNILALEFRSRLGAGLSNWSAAQGAKAQIEAARYQFDSSLRDVRQQITTDYSRLSTLVFRIDLARSAQSSAESVFDSYRRQYLAGKKSWLDVIIAADDLARAKAEVIDTEVDYLVVSWRLLLSAQGIQALPGAVR